MDLRRRRQDPPVLAAEPEPHVHPTSPVPWVPNGACQYTITLIQDYAALVYRVCLHWPLHREILGNILNKLPTNVSNMFATKNPYNPETDVPDLTGKVAIVTGGSLSCIFGILSLMSGNRECGSRKELRSGVCPPWRKSVYGIQDRAEGCKLYRLVLHITCGCKLSVKLPASSN